MDTSGSFTGLTGTNPLIRPPNIASMPVSNHEVENSSTAIASRPSIADENDSTADDTESLDSNNSMKKDVTPRTVTPRNSSRGITMQTLLQEGVLEPGNGVLSIEYLGQKYFGDLLPNGKITWDNTQFASPSSWATYIKKRVNPAKKSGCGWNSVKYKGKKLDKLKSNWFRKHSQSNLIPGLPSASANPLEEDKSVNADHKLNQDRRSIKAIELKHKFNCDPNTFVEYDRFDDNIGKSQPFSVMVSASVLLLIDFHSHMTTNEMLGYLGGKWDPMKKCLYIMQAFPCRCKLGDPEVAAMTEQEISNGMGLRGLLRVGWYHSHPNNPTEPTIRDIDVQCELQLMFNTHPTVGLICGPYDYRDGGRPESTFDMFWMATPADLNPDAQWYGVPMKVSYNEVTEQSVQEDLPHELNQIVEFYKHQPDVISFKSIWKGSMTYIDKIKLSLQRKVSQDKTGNQFLHFVYGLLTNAASSTS